jgi:prepilin-type N-terminal cleavage/methylation domain-containing protein
VSQLKNKTGFTLIEVILVLVILGILAAVAVPKFFDMQEGARIKALNGCIAMLNGEVNTAFANNIAINGFNGGYDGYVGSGDPAFVVTGQIPDTPATGTIKYKNHTDIWELIWTPGPFAGPESNKKPGYFKLGNKI